MVSSKIFVLAVLLIGVQSRHVYLDHPVVYTDNRSNDLEDSIIKMRDQPFESYGQHHVRVARQLHGSMSTNPDGSANIAAKLPLIGGDSNVLSAIASGNGLQNPNGPLPGGYKAVTGGLQLENINGHSLTATKTHIPNFGDQLTAAGKVNLLHTQDHNLNANAFVTRNMPSIPNVPNFNTHGGGIDYMFKDKIGGSLSVAQTPLFQKTDLSALGNLNLFKDRSSSLDFSAGATRSFSPFIPKSSWQPTFGLSFSRGF